MAVKASGSVTVASINDVASTTRYYLLQSSTLTAPSAPTASPPGGSWAATEPTYTEGSTNSLYTCDQTIFSDGTWAYSSVSLSSSYEASKTAYNKAVAAAAAAAATDQHFWWGTDGAHVSSTGDHDTSGFHQLITSVKNAFMHGTTELMTISENLIELGKNSTSAVIKMVGGKLSFSYGPASAPGKSSAIIGSPDTIVINSQSGIYQLHVKDISSADAASFTSAVSGTTLMGNVMVRDSDDLTEALVDVSVSSMPSDNALNGCRGSITLYSGGTDSSGVTTPPQLEMHAVTKGVAYAENAKISLHRFITAIQPVVLYNGGAALTYDTAPGAGTTGTVTLSETAAHFRELTIFYHYEATTRSVTLHSPNGWQASLYLMYVDAYGGLWTKTRTVSISGTSITNATNAANLAIRLTDGACLIAQSLSTPEIIIDRVEGRR